VFAFSPSLFTDLGVALAVSLSTAGATSGSSLPVEARDVPATRVVVGPLRRGVTLPIAEAIESPPAMTVTAPIRDAVAWAYRTVDEMGGGSWSLEARDRVASALMRCMCHATMHNDIATESVAMLSEYEIDRMTMRLVGQYFAAVDRTTGWVENRRKASNVGSHAIMTLLGPFTRIQPIDGTMCASEIARRMRPLDSYGSLFSTSSPKY
jgi:hypothetical protein